MAAKLAGDLVAGVDLVAVQVVQHPCPLEPDSRTQFLRDQIGEIVAESAFTISPLVVLTRDPLHAYTQLLPPHSLVLMRKPKWLSSEARLARHLRQAGHDVLEVEV